MTNQGIQKVKQQMIAEGWSEQAVHELAPFLISFLRRYVEEVGKKIVKEFTVHRQLEKEWTGIRLDGIQRNNNPHKERAEELQESLANLLSIASDFGVEIDEKDV